MIIMSIELFGLENIPIIDGNSDISKIIKEAIENISEVAAEEAAKQARLRTSWLKEKEIFEQAILELQKNTPLMRL